MDELSQVKQALKVAIEQRNNSENQIITLSVALYVAGERIKELEKEKQTYDSKSNPGTD